MAKQDEFRDPQAEHDLAAGLCVHGGDAYIDTEGLVDADAFGDPLPLAVWKSATYALETYGLETKLDLSSLLSASRAVKVDSILDAPDGIRYLRTLFRMPIELDTVRRQALRMSKLRAIAGLDAIQAHTRERLRKFTGDEPMSDIFAAVENPLFDFISDMGDAEGEGPAHIALGIDEFLASLEENPSDNVGISTGYARYDDAIGGGLRRSTVTVLGAREKRGKSVMCDNIALHVAGRLKIPVLNLDTEMTRPEHLARILAHICDAGLGVEVTIKDIEKGRFAQNAEQRDAVHKMARWLKSRPYDYESVIDKSFEEHIATIRRWVRRRVGYDEKGRVNDCLVIYDYLQPPQSGEFAEHLKDYQVLGYQMMSLLKTAARCDVPIFTPCQLNREGDVADSIRILRKAASFSILGWKSEGEQASDGPDEGTHKLEVKIARHGEGTVKDDYISLKFDRKSARIIEGRLKSEIERDKKERPVKGLVVDPPKAGEGEADNPADDAGPPDLAA